MKAGTHRLAKFKALARALDRPRPFVIGLLELLWAHTYRAAPAGDIGRESDADIAEEMLWDGDDPAKLINALVETGWLERHPIHRLIVHDWADHAPEYLQKRKRAKKLAFVRTKDGQYPDNIRPLENTTEAPLPYQAVPNQAEPGQAAAPASGDPANDLPDIARIEQPQDRVVEMSEAAQILTGLIERWNATKGKRRLCLSSGQTLEIAIRQKIIERGIPILEIPNFRLKLVADSVRDWQQHCRKRRDEKGQATRTPPWGLGYLANAWFAQDEKRHDTAAKQDAVNGEANEVARQLLMTKAAEDDHAAKMTAWGKLEFREQGRILKAHRAEHGNLSVKPAAIAEWWQQQKGHSDVQG